MRYSCFFLSMLLSARAVHGFATVRQQTALRPSCGSNLSSAPAASSKLFSSAAAMPPSGSPVDVNYGPSINVGKLKLNLFGAIFGFYECLWGALFWLPAVTLYRLLRWISSKLPGDLLGKLDPFRRIPINIAFIWGVLSFTPFGLWPAIEGKENLEVLRESDENGKKGKLKPAMYVGNHCSWMDIPFVAWVLGFRNYKMIAKAELEKVPILGPACKAGGHVMLDRTNRRSQMKAFKDGVQFLKDGVNLVTFAEGTRSKNGKLQSFKKGAFKMAQSVGAPIVPMSICYADTVQPREYIFPAKSSRTRPRAVIKVGKPIMTEGKTDDDLLQEVWQAIADNLPKHQKPAKDTPVGAA